MYRTKIEQNWEEYVSLLEGAIAIPSVKSEAGAGAPFGAKPRQVLDYVMEKAQSYGLETQIVKDAMGYAQLGEGEDYIGVVGHLDVVAADGPGWLSPPFKLEEREGYFYGRGVLDNKGPILSCLFALKLLKERNFKPRLPIRIIFGTDEESGSADVPLYLSEEKAPVFGFTPDCKFPVVYGERGVVALELTTRFAHGVLDSLGDFHGAMAKEFVPDDIQLSGGRQTYSAKGLRTPSNAPELGKNAITALAALLQNNLENRELRHYFSWLTHSFHEKHFGQGVGIAFADQESGRLILTPYKIKRENNLIHLSLSIRYPVTVTEEQVMNALSENLYAGTSIKIIRSLPGTYVDKTKQEIQDLSNIYEEVTGLNGQPVTTTGATYARSMPNVVAFGPSFPGEKGIAHKENEYIKIEHLKQMVEIYMKSIERLGQ
ncbi:M20 family peptidase [Lactococcus petauri]|uniref:Sapep family Mn(2+)-dependent dipeptidase n=1 Tax=Lactococcus petauri TaxID=1940789 RepID=UPI000E417247|nr:Sapep family Mn(2+)-dependent dipeptidase [Lactococcus petauri]RGB60145.1 M20 family peptidase [Lactococcus petauri]